MHSKSSSGPSTLHLLWLLRDFWRNSSIRLFSVKTNRLWLPRCLFNNRSHSSDIVELHACSITITDYVFGHDVSTGRWFEFSSEQGKHLAVWRGSLYGSSLTPGIPLQGLCQAKSPSKPLLEAPMAHSHAVIQFHNKHSWHTTRRSIKEAKVVLHNLQLLVNCLQWLPRLHRNIMAHCNSYCGEKKNDNAIIT